MRFSLTCLLVVFIIGVVGNVWPQSMKSEWASLDGARVHYYDIGSRKNKNALVLIHGWTCNADFGKDSFSAFSQYRVIVVDLPGHGRSDKPTLNYSIGHFARSVDAVMKDAGVNKAVFAGHSMGAPIARQFYRLYPDRTLGIIVIDGPLRPLAPKTEMDKFVANLRSNYGVNTARYIDGMIKEIKDESLKKTIREGMLATPDYVRISAIEGMADEKVWGNDKINVPVLAIMAPLRENWPPGIEEAYASLAPDIDFREWTGVSHFLMMEKPKEFNETVRSFIAKKKLL